MKASRRLNIGNKSIMGRLLWPINIISFLMLLALFTVLIMREQNALDNALQAKVQDISRFLATTGKQSLIKKDLSLLKELTATAADDANIVKVEFIDDAEVVLANTDRVASSNDDLTMRTPIVDATGKSFGSVVVTYNRSSLFQAQKESLLIGFISVLIAQALLSFTAYFFTSRGVIHPLRESLARLFKTTYVLSNTSFDVSKLSDTLSDGVSQQAEVVQETTAAMTEMSSMLSQTSSYAKQSETVMGSVTQKANNGMDVMIQMVDAMSAIEQANQQLQQMVEIIKEIGSKTNVINDIVLKTQLLSFNASIEAARAGQHGRGFSVVAEEVGNLAKLSGSAAQEIGSLLEDSERQVNDIVRNTSDRIAVGKSVAEHALKGFKEIASNINQVSDQIASISSATREQELGVAQTNRAMAELNKTTDINNQMMLRASTTSTTLSSEVRILNEISAAIERTLKGENRSQKSEGGNGHNKSDSAHAGDKKITPGISDHESKVNAAAHDVPGNNAPDSAVATRILEMAKKQRDDSRIKRSV